MSRRQFVGNRRLLKAERFYGVVAGEVILATDFDGESSNQTRFRWNLIDNCRFECEPFGAEFLPVGTLRAELSVPQYDVLLVGSTSYGRLAG